MSVSTTVHEKLALAAERGLRFGRRFSSEGVHPYDEVDWEIRDSRIVNFSDGSVAFEQRDVEFPAFWSQNATNIVTQKYFRGKLGTPARETSLRQVIDRVVHTITGFGLDGGYFADEHAARVFEAELTYLMLHQRAAFNSPVWFNVGAEPHPQASACFILSVDDTMDSILNWYVEEGTIFKGGSGSGANLSRIRSSKEQLSAGGSASGPVSFMRGADASAGTIKSGGKTRRAAKMVILNADHPDIEDFIWCKALEERKARVLRDAGFDMDLDGKDAYSMQYQNANNSVRVTDEFMQAVVTNRDWSLLSVMTGEVQKTLPARDLIHQMAEAAWECADPGLQYDTTINRWHTCPESGRINASNPCSEYLHVDNSACNLASINLLKYLNSDGSFSVTDFEHTVDVMFVAQEILVGASSYPTERIGENARAFRQLGLGFANLGALLMARGVPYDSDEGRAWAASITALMTGRAYRTSAEVAARLGAFEAFPRNADAMTKVMHMHRDAVGNIDSSLAPMPILQGARTAWDDAVTLGAAFGWRNAQATVLAPTGTISFMMDCDTTGIEPDLALIKHKKLVAGGNMEIVNQTVPRALERLGYHDEAREAILAYLGTEHTIVGAPAMERRHYPVFACSMGDNTIHYMGHVKMVAAVQPFLSGAASKTVNMPETVTIADVEELYIEAWRMGIKAIALYRDNCKVAQPLSAKKKDGAAAPGAPGSGAPGSGGLRSLEEARPERKPMPARRPAQLVKFRVADCEGFLTTGEYPDDGLGEIFLNVAKQGSTLAGIMDAFAVSISLGLQYGVPLESYVKQFVNTRFEPAGITDDAEVRFASSLVDYIFRRLAIDYLAPDVRERLGIQTVDERQQSLPLPDIDAAAPLLPADDVRTGYTPVTVVDTRPERGIKALDAPMCHVCGSQMRPAGSCYACESCGATSGCS